MSESNKILEKTQNIKVTVIKKLNLVGKKVCQVKENLKNKREEKRKKASKKRKIKNLKKIFKKLFKKDTILKIVLIIATASMLIPLFVPFLR
ncbi:MAG TPA: hypothetical protein PLT50_01370 [bacterium]|nr:hypothetical protein [bacterium]